MSKSRKKYDGTKAIVIKQLSAKLEFTPDYIRKCLRGDSDAPSAEEVKREYNRLYKEINNILIKG